MEQAQNHVNKETKESLKNKQLKGDTKIKYEIIPTDIQNVYLKRRGGVVSTDLPKGTIIA